MDMRIIDDEGKELPHDGKAYGELQVRGPHVIQRYYRVNSHLHENQRLFRGLPTDYMHDLHDLCGALLALQPSCVS